MAHDVVVEGGLGLGVLQDAEVKAGMVLIFPRLNTQ